MSRKLLTPGMVKEIHRLRLEVNEWGEAKWTGSDIAQVLGVSESTIWRVIRKKAAYARADLVLQPRGEQFVRMDSALKAIQANPTQELDGEAQASLARLQERMAADLQKGPGASPIDELSGDVAERARKLL